MLYINDLISTNNSTFVRAYDVTAKQSKNLLTVQEGVLFLDDES